MRLLDALAVLSPEEFPRVRLGIELDVLVNQLQALFQHGNALLKCLILDAGVNVYAVPLRTVPDAVVFRWHTVNSLHT